MIQIRLKRVSDGSNGISGRNENGSLSISWFPMAEEGSKAYNPAILANLLKQVCGGGGSDRNINGAWVENPITTKDAGTGNGNREKVAVTVVAIYLCTYGSGGDGTVLIRYWAYEE